MSLEQLIHNCKNNDRDAQAQLYREFSKKLYATSLKYSRNKLEAEDNLQDSFMVIFEKIGQYNFKGSFEGWLRRITVNTVLQKYRNKGIFEVVNERVLKEESVTIYEEDVSLDYLLNIVQELPDRYRLVFNLYVLDDYSHQEIAEMLGISVGTSKSNLARARMILKQKVESFKKKIAINE
ncbi:RNA polymerase sigma-70 factor (ECF subfamily) [Kordia periserrulae]|uniref:RNA polymerase sigma-70 factor (ECF subfamily) n=1 Tax=Kordia periserrulae TaxID=701523 RepID=A0A2T6BWB6_9FLAO|nr:sigma-70 family RNA polymerase sigma factor [Kordia periserrulae]PTX60372.1 RNA polymerase sigma-70 factor (ECF subfamily) [Kordia periserrulae]